MSTSAPVYECSTEGAVALVATTAKTIAGVKAHANSGLLLSGIVVGFDGITATDKPVLVELCYCTWATNSPGTASTSTTPRQTRGRVLTAGFTSGKTWTTEPTVLTVIRDLPLTPIGGLLVYDKPLGKEYDCALGEGFAIRCTAPTSAVNGRAVLEVSRI